MSRFVALRTLKDLETVAAAWPFESIERQAIAVGDSLEEVRMLAAREPGRVEILSLEDAEARVLALRKHIAGKAERLKHAFSTSRAK